MPSLAQKLLLFSGGSPAIEVTPSSWDFGSTPVGTPVSKEFTIENTGTRTLEITLPITTLAGFTVTVDPVTSVAPGASTTFTLRADAGSAAVFAGNISIQSNAASSPTLIPVTATVANEYFVSTTGNDTTGDGTSGTPWLTIHKALTTIAIGTPAIINVAAGTYAENSSALGYLRITRVFTAPIKVLGVGAVTLTDSGAGANYCVRLSGCNNVTLENMTITPAAAKAQGTISIDAANTSVTLTNCTVKSRQIGLLYDSSVAGCVVNLYGCTFNKHASASGNQRCVQANVAASPSSLTLNIVGGTYTGESASATVAAIGLAVIGLGTGTLITSISGATISSTGGYALRQEGGTINVASCTISASTAVACVFGNDGAASFSTIGTLNNCTITSTSSHGLMVGQKVNGFTGASNTVSGGDYGVVFKNCDNAYLTDCDFATATGASVYFKGARASGVTYSTLTNASVRALLLQADITNNSNITFTHNTITVTGSSRCMQWATADDAGGAICDYNTYDHSGSSAGVGDVLAVADITTLSALQAAWAGYETGTNDDHSTVIG